MEIALLVVPVYPHATPSSLSGLPDRTTLAALKVPSSRCDSFHRYSGFG